MVRPGLWLAALALALPAWVNAAQDAGRWPRPPVADPEFGSTTDELLPEIPLELVAVGYANAEALRDVPSGTLRGFDEARYGLSELTVFLARDLPPLDWERDKAARLHIFVVARRADGQARWWRLMERDAAGTELEIPDVIVPGGLARLDVSRPPIYTVVEPSLPVIGLTYDFGETRHPRHTEHVTTDLLLDFRGESPRILGVMRSTRIAGCIGNCGSDCGYSDLRRTSCRWDPAASEFVCHETLDQRDYSSGGRTGSRWFTLLTGARVPSPRAEDGPFDPRQESAPAAGVTAGRTQVVDGLGPVTLVGAVQVGGRRAWLVASADLTQGYGVRFHAAPIDGGRRGRLIPLASRVDVRTQPLDDGGRTPAEIRFSASPHPDFVPDAVPAFTVTPVLTRGRLTIVTVTAAEGDASGTRRSVWAVGLQRTPMGLVGDVLPLAFDGATYQGCRRHLQPATAVGLVARRATPGFVLDVEPAYEWDQVEENEPLDALDDRELGCRARLAVGWTPGEGFAVTSRAVQCGSPPRRVTISPDGRLTTRPGLRAAPRARSGGDE